MVVKRNIFILVSLVLLLLPVVLAEEKDCLYYFYGKDCPGCTEVSQQLQLLQEKYPQLTIKQFEVYFDRANERILQKYFTAYHVAEASQGVPIVFTSGSYFLGAKSIQNSLENRVLANTDQSCPAIEGGEIIGLVGGEKSSYHVLDTLNFFKLTGAGIGDGFRAGMMGILAILIMVLTLVKNPREGLQRGAIFVVVLFSVYLLFSFGFLDWFASSGFYTFFTKTVGVIALGFSIVKLKLYFGRKQVLLSEETISEQTRGKMDFIADLPRSTQGVLAISFLAALLSVGKTSEVYSLLRSFSLDSAASSVIHLIIFHLFLILLPAVGVVVLYHHSKKYMEHHAQRKEPRSDLNIERQRRTNQRLFELTTSSILFAIGLLLVLL